MKNQEKEQGAPNLPVNPLDYSYRGTETITMTAQQFLTIFRAVETAIEKSITRRFISQGEWVSTLTGQPVVTPTQEDVKKGLVKQITSLEKTFDVNNPRNFQESFEDWVFPNVIDGKAVLMEVHAAMIETGVSSLTKDLQKEMQEAHAAQMAETKANESKANMEVVVDEELPEQEVPVAPPVPIDTDAEQVEDTEE